MANNIFSRLAIRRGTKANLKVTNPLLREGEPCAELDTGKLKIGDGKKRWNQLRYVGGGGNSPLTCNLTAPVVNFEKGQEIRNFLCDYSFTGEPDVINLTSYSNSREIEYPESSSGTMEFTGPFNMNTNNLLKMIAITDETSVESSLTLKFLSSVYYGVLESNTIENIEDIPDMSLSKLSSSLKEEYSLDTTGMYAYMAIPASILNNRYPLFKLGIDGASPIGIGGMSILTDNGFREENNLSNGRIIHTITNRSGYNEPYYIFRTNYSNLGNLKITIDFSN